MEQYFKGLYKVINTLNYYARLVYRLLDKKLLLKGIAVVLSD